MCIRDSLGAARYAVHGIFQWRKIKKRRNLLLLWRDVRFLRIGARGKRAFRNLQVALFHFFALLHREFFQLADVHLQRIREVRKIEWQQVRIRQAHGGDAASLRERAAVRKIRVSKVRVPVKIIVSRMIDSAAALPAKPDIQRSDANDVEEGTVVGAAAERANAQIGAIASLLAIVLFIGTDDLPELHAFPQRQLGLRILYVACYVIDELLERVRALCPEETAAVNIRIDIRHGVLAQFVGMRLHPFRGAEQARLFAIPGAKNDRALGLPSGLHQFRGCARLFQQGHLPGDGILGAVHPRVMVIPTNHPFVRIHGPGYFCDHVVQRLDVPIGKYFKVHFRGPRADVIGKRQASAPCEMCIRDSP